MQIVMTRFDDHGDEIETRKVWIDAEPMIRDDDGDLVDLFDLFTE